jgi:hypothetical protein
MIALQHLHAAFHEEMHAYAAPYCALLQPPSPQAAGNAAGGDAGTLLMPLRPSASSAAGQLAAAALELDPASARAATAAMRAAGGGSRARAVVSGSVYGSLHRRLVPRGRKPSNDDAEEAAAEEEEEAPPPSPRQAITRFYA